jgi:hypothetical protein
MTMTWHEVKNDIIIPLPKEFDMNANLQNNEHMVLSLIKLNSHFNLSTNLHNLFFQKRLKKC